MPLIQHDWHLARFGLSDFSPWRFHPGLWPMWDTDLAIVQVARCNLYLGSDSNKDGSWLHHHQHAFWACWCTFCPYFTSKLNNIQVSDLGKTTTTITTTKQRQQQQQHKHKHKHQQHKHQHQHKHQQHQQQQQQQQRSFLVAPRNNSTHPCWCRWLQLPRRDHKESMKLIPPPWVWLHQSRVFLISSN